MIPRGRLDIGWHDFIAGSLYCLDPRSREAAQRRVEELSTGSEALICLSVRSGLDLFLKAMAYPPGSEILVSAITIQNMVEIIEHHGLAAVPVDMDMENLTVKRDSLVRAISPKSKAVLVAHLFGSRMDLAPVAQVASERGLLLIEDCAQSFSRDGYWGHDDSDFAITSFGPLKTATALGGAVGRVKDAALLQRMKEIQDGHPVQGRWMFFKRVARFALMRALMYPAPFSLFYGACRLRGKNHDDVFSQAIRGFTPANFFWKIRHQPSAPLLRLMARRISGKGDSWVRRRTATAEAAIKIMPGIRRPGRTAANHTHWVLPILSPTPDCLAHHLWGRGFDANRGRWSLYVVPAPTSRPEMHAEEANRVMSEVVYTPVYPVVRQPDIERLARALAEFDSRPGGQPDPPGTGLNSAPTAPA